MAGFVKTKEVIMLRVLGIVLFISNLAFAGFDFDGSKKQSQ